MWIVAHLHVRDVNDLAEEAEKAFLASVVAGQFQDGRVNRHERVLPETSHVQQPRTGTRFHRSQIPFQSSRSFRCPS